MVILVLSIKNHVTCESDNARALLRVHEALTKRMH